MRHYLGRVPSGPVTPYVVSLEITGNSIETHGTEDDAEDTADETRLQLSCYDPTLTVCIALRKALRAALLDPQQVASRAVLVAAGVSVSDPDTREQDEPDVDLRCAMLDVTVFHNPNN